MLLRVARPNRRLSPPYRLCRTELAVIPFLRVARPESETGFRALLGLPATASDRELFAALRARKDTFKLQCVDPTDCFVFRFMIQLIFVSESDESSLRFD